MSISVQEFNNLFSALKLGADYVPSLLEVTEPRVFRPGEPLIAHGQQSDTLFLVVTGTVDVSVDVEGARLELGRIGPGRWVGEFGLIDPAPASAAATAVDEVETLALDSARLQQLHERAPAAASDLLVRLSLDLAHRLRQTSRQQLVADGEGFSVQDQDTSSAGGAPGRFARLGKLLGIGGG